MKQILVSGSITPSHPSIKAVDGSSTPNHLALKGVTTPKNVQKSSSSYLKLSHEPKTTKNHHSNSKLGDSLKKKNNGSNTSSNRKRITIKRFDSRRLSSISDRRGDSA